MLDLKVVNSVLQQLEQERGIPRAKVIEAIEMALATAYKKEYGQKSQIIKAKFDINSGTSEFFQIKMVVDGSTVVFDPNDEAEEKIYVNEAGEEVEKDIFNPERHTLISDAKKIKKDVKLGEEMVFPLETKDDYGRIASQTAKQVIIQKLREAEKTAVLKEYGAQEGSVIVGSVQRIERGNIFVDVGRATGMISYEDQIPGEHYRQGERIRAYLYRVEESPRGIFLRLSRSHPQFLAKLFEVEVPEIGASIVAIKSIAREAGSRSKIAVASTDTHIDPVGSMVGQRGVRVTTVMSELGGEKIDIIEWSADPKKFVEDSLSPAKILSVDIDEAEKKALIKVSDDQQSLAIGKGGQNVRLAAKLTGYKIDIQSSAPAEVSAEEASTESESGK